MKKLLVIYAAILIGLFLILSLLDQGSNYSVERRIWKVNKEQSDIAQDPNVVPDQQFENIIAEYREIIEKFPNSPLTPGLYIRVGEVYALWKNYDEARKIFYEMINLFPENKNLLAEAIYKVGKTYEVTDNWPKAYEVYQGVIKRYPLTDVGLRMSIYIADYYRSQNDFQGTMTAYEMAIRHYKKVAADQADTRVGLSAMRYLSNCYLDQNRWMEAINTLGLTIEKYSTTEYLTVKEVDTMIKTVNITAAYQMKDYDIAIKLYEGIIARNPGHPLESYLHKVIDAFNQLKAKGVEASDLK